MKIDIENAKKEVFEDDAFFLAFSRNTVVELHIWIKPGNAVVFSIA